MDFLAGLNRVLRTEGIIRGDDDEVTSFSDTQHANTINLAKIAIQDELTHLIAFEFIPYEEADATITMIGSDTPTVTNRVYNLASDFMRFQDEAPYFLKEDSSGDSENLSVIEYPGGERSIRRTFYDYRETTGEPQWFYFTGGTTKKVGFFHIPDDDADGIVYRYYYEKDVSVSVETDSLPFITTMEANTFIELASRRFKYSYASPAVRVSLFPQGVDKDPGMESTRAVLAELMKGKRPSKGYGRRYD